MRPIEQAVARGGATLAVLAVAACAQDCSAPQAATAEGGGGAAATGSVTGSTTGSGAAGSSASGAPVDRNGCAILPYPATVPEGWVEWTDWSCDCRFYIPGSKEAMPAPIEWVPCPDDTGIPGCERMASPWTNDPHPIVSHQDMPGRFDRDADGSAVLMFRRLMPSGPSAYSGEPMNVVDLVAEADGAVRWAMLEVYTQKFPGCWKTPQSMKGGTVVVQVRGDDVTERLGEGGPLHDGILGGPMDATPVVLFREATESYFSWTGDSSWLLRVNGLPLQAHAMPWSMSPEYFVYSPSTDPEGFTAGQYVLGGGAVFFKTGGLKIDGINVWEPVRGTRPFIRWIGDYTKGAADLGTDGIDLVWTYAEGKQPDDITYPIRSIMTAKFTTDPAELKPRRLRSQPHGNLGGALFAVGCGYAAHHSWGTNTLIVRISDGVSWETPQGVELRHPLGITCDHVYIYGQLGGQSTIARIALAALGPGMPPD